jgi:thioredoxin 1
MANLKAVDDKNFDAEVVESDLPVLVDFWAPWCGPCKMIGPLLEELADEYRDRIKVVKVNTQDSQEVAMMLGVRSVPTVVLFHGHEVIDAFVGARPKVAYAKALDKYLKKIDKIQKKEDKRQARLAAKNAIA